jgi:hypothetical protein
MGNSNAAWPLIFSFFEVPYGGGSKFIQIYENSTFNHNL